MKAFAKLNLQLYVIDKRSDGYHNLQMVNTRIGLYDSIKIYKNQNQQDQVIYINCPNLSFGSNDLILNVIKDFKKKFNIFQFYTIKIIKRIPIGAGLGGASMDVAQIIKYLVKKNKIKLDINELIDFLKPFGSDIPYGLYTTPCIVEGLGEKITEVELKVKKFIIIYPNITISTKTIFNKCDITNSIKSHEKLIKDTNLNIYHNDLENIVLSNYLELKKIRDYLSKFGQPFMTGSGSCYVLLPQQNIIESYQEIKRHFLNYKVEIIKTKKGKKKKWKTKTRNMKF